MAFMISKVADRILRESYSHCLHKLPELKPYAVEFRAFLKELITKKLTSLIRVTRKTLSGEPDFSDEVILTDAVGLLALREIGLTYELHAVFSVVGNVLARGKSYTVEAPEGTLDIEKRTMMRDQWEESRSIVIGTQDPAFVYDEEVSRLLKIAVESSCMDFYKEATEELRRLLKDTKVTSSDKRMVEYLSEQAATGISVIQLIEDIAEDPIPVRIGDLEDPENVQCLYVFDLDKTLANYYSRSLKPLSKEDLSSTKPTVELRKKFKSVAGECPLLVLTARSSKDREEVREWIKKNLKVSEEDYDLMMKEDTSLRTYMQTPEWKSKQVSKYIDSISCKSDISSIVFYDDRLDNLVAVQSLAHSRGLRFTGYAMF